MIQVLMVLLRFYRTFISPMLPRACRFHPSCSVYAMGAIRVHGPIHGSWFAAKRICRCHPWHPPGIDCIPPLGETSADVILAASDPRLAELVSQPPSPFLAATFATKTVHHP